MHKNLLQAIKNSLIEIKKRPVIKNMACVLQIIIKKIGDEQDGESKLLEVKIRLS